jgi:hypothetical protein
MYVIKISICIWNKIMSPQKQIVGWCEDEEKNSMSKMVVGVQAKKNVHGSWDQGSSIVQQGSFS